MRLLKIFLLNFFAMLIVNLAICALVIFPLLAAGTDEPPASGLIFGLFMTVMPLLAAAILNALYAFIQALVNIVKDSITEDGAGLALPDFYILTWTQWILITGGMIVGAIYR